MIIYANVDTYINTMLSQRLVMLFEYYGINYNSVINHHNYKRFITELYKLKQTNSPTTVSKLIERYF